MTWLIVGRRWLSEASRRAWSCHAGVNETQMWCPSVVVHASVSYYLRCCLHAQNDVGNTRRRRHQCDLPPTQLQSDTTLISWPDGPD